MEFTRTRVSVPTQLREAGHTVSTITASDGRLLYVIDGETMTLSDAADQFLSGGWDVSYGRQA